MRVWLIGMALAAAAAPAEAQDLSAVPEWLAGAWCTEGPATDRTCEYWSPLSGGTMLGASITVKEGKTMSYEFMRIAVEQGRPIFYGMPGGNPAVRFFNMPAGPGQAVMFAAPMHDYPKFITYQREGNVLTASTVGESPSTDTMTWRYTRLGD